jgi:hypothetical protein
MALSVLDGNQSATTLSSVVTGGEHIVAHSVVSLGSNAISNITTAISGSTVCVGNLGLLQSTVATEGLSASGSFIKIGGHTGTSTTGNIVHVSAIGALRVDGSVYTQPISIASVTIGNTVTIAGTVTANSGANFDVRVTQGGDPVDSNNAFPIFGTVTANLRSELQDSESGYFHQLSRVFYYDSVAGFPEEVSTNKPLPISGTVTIGSALPAGTNRIGVVTIGGGSVTIGAGTAQIGSVTASISNSLTIASLPALVAGTAQIGSVTASISNSVVTFYPMQGTTVTNSNFTSITASTTLVSAVANREVLTVFNEGAGNLHISPGATCTTISYQVRLSPGDYWECPNGQLSLAHTAVFATAGTARVTQVS